MLKRTLIASAVLLSASANAYMFEGTYTYTGSKTTPSANGVDGDDFDVENHEVDLRVYLQDVDVNKGAWDEAAFLNKASFVAGQWLGRKHDTTPETKSNAYQVGGQAVVNDFILRGSIATRKRDEENNKDQNSSFGFGAYFNEYHALVGDVSFMKGNDRFGGYDIYRLGANYHGYFPVGTSPMSMALDVTLFVDSGTYDFSVGALEVDSDTQSGGMDATFTFFPLPQVGIGASLLAQAGTIDRVVDPDLDVTTVNSSIFVHWYPVEQFRIGAAFEAEGQKAEEDGTSNDIEFDTNSFAVDLRVRF